MRQAIKDGVWIDKGSYKPVIKEWIDDELNEGACLLTDEDIKMCRAELASVGLEAIYRRKNYRESEVI